MVAEGFGSEPQRCRTVEQPAHVRIVQDPQLPHVAFLVMQKEN